MINLLIICLFVLMVFIALVVFLISEKLSVLIEFLEEIKKGNSQKDQKDSE